MPYHSINADGNYEIVFLNSTISESNEYTVCYKFEVTPEANIKDITITALSSTGVLTSREKIEFGTIVDSDVAELLTVARNAGVTQ